MVTVCVQGSGLTASVSSLAAPHMNMKTWPRKYSYLWTLGRGSFWNPGSDQPVSPGNPSLSFLSALWEGATRKAIRKHALVAQPAHGQTEIENHTASSSSSNAWLLLRWPFPASPYPVFLSRKKIPFVFFFFLTNASARVSPTTA